MRHVLELPAEKVPAEQAAMLVAPTRVDSKLGEEEVARKPAGVAKQPVLSFSASDEAEGAYLPR